MANRKTEIQVIYPPQDVITSLNFSPESSKYIIASSWDGYVRLYDLKTNALRQKYSHPCPVLDLCFQDAVHTISGGLDGGIQIFDINANRVSIVGTHESAVKCVEFANRINAVMTGSWDKTVRCWDTRAKICVGKFEQNDGKVYSMDVLDEKLVVATSERKVLIWDLRNMSNCMARRESFLKYQTRCVKIIPNKEGFIMSSIEGRVAVEYFDNNPEIQREKFVFKCHRILEPGMLSIYPVNAISFHKVYSTFVTGGSDGFVSVWDKFNRKRLCQFHNYGASISALAISNDSSSLAIGCSFLDMYGKPLERKFEPSIIVRSVLDQDFKPQPRT